MYWPVDVFERSITGVFYFERHFSPCVIEDRLRYADAPRVRQPFESGRNVHAIAVDVVAIDDNVAEINTHAEVNPTTLWCIGVPGIHTFLNLDTTTYCIHDRGKLYQDAVASTFDDSPSMLCDLHVDELAAMSLQARKRPFLVLAHQPAIAHHIGGKDRGKPALSTFLRHVLPL
jgi:hypothetical protein